VVPQQPVGPVSVTSAQQNLLHDKTEPDPPITWPSQRWKPPRTSLAKPQHGPRKRRGTWRSAAPWCTGQNEQVWEASAGTGSILLGLPPSSQAELFARQELLRTPSFPTAQRELFQPRV